MNQVDLLITNGHIITQNAQGDEVLDGAIAVRGTDIVAVGPTPELLKNYQAKRTIDASYKFVFPGFINTHNHLFQNFLKGLGEGVFVHSWIVTITVPGLHNMTDQDFYLSSRAGCLDAIRSGTTTVVEYMYPNPHHSMADSILEGMADSGIRGLLGRGVADIGASEGDIVRNAFFAELLEPVPQAMDDCARLVKVCRERGAGRVGFCLAPPYMRCLTPEMLGIIREFAETHNCLITMHIGETPRDDEVIAERHGKLAVQWLDEEGFLGPDLLAVHCINLVDDAIRRFANHDVKVSYNPVSNMYLGNGVAPILKLREQGVTVGLATDGAASNNNQDMLEVMKTGVLLQRAANRKPAALSGRDALRMATIDAARAIGMEDIIGSLDPGKRADITIVDFRQLKPAPYYDPINTLLFSADPRVIDTVVIDGQVVLENKQFPNFDEEAFVQEVIAAGHDLARRTYGPDVLKYATAIH